MLKKPLNAVDGETLWDMEFGAQRFCIRGLLPQGLCALGGASKIGKSWLVLDWCIRIARGEPIWGMETRQGATLYLCLEDTLQRVQHRIYRVSDEATPNAHFATAAGTLADDLEEQISSFLLLHPDTVLIVVDTLQVARLSHTTMSNMISNPKYKGYYVGNKVKVIDMFTKKQKFLPPEEWVMFKDESGEIVPSIVSEELWEKANAVLRKRSDDVKSRQGICNHANLLTGKLYCPCCGAAYYRRESRDRQGNRNSKWVCSGKIKNGADSCASFPIYEEEIKPLLFEVFKETEADAEAMLEEYLRLYQSLDSNGAQQQITAIEQKIDFETRKKRKLLDYNITGQITDNEYLQRSRDCEQEIDQLQKQLAELQQGQESKEDFRKHMESIRSVMRDAQRDANQQIVSKEFIDKYIDKIFATPQEDGSLRLEIKIFTGEATEKYLSRLKERAADRENTPEYATVGAGRTGHMFKKMIEAYEQGLQ